MNRAAPGVVRVVQVSDVHLTGAGGSLFVRDPDVTFALVVDDVREHAGDLDLVVATGDLVHDGLPAGYRRLAEAFGRFDAPVYCLSGNHDFQVPFEACLPRPNVHVARSVRIGDWLLLFLDSNADGRVESDAGTLEDRPDRFMAAVTANVHPHDLAWADAVLAATDAPHVMVCMHHPAIDPWTESKLAGGGFTDRLFEVLTRHGNVRAITSGHVHAASECERDGIRSFTCPSTWLALDFEALTMLPPGYRSFALHPSGDVETSVRFVDDERFAARDPLPDWALKAIRGELHHDDPSGSASVS